MATQSQSGVIGSIFVDETDKGYTPFGFTVIGAPPGSKWAPGEPGTPPVWIDILLAAFVSKSNITIQYDDKTRPAYIKNVTINSNNLAAQTAPADPTLGNIDNIVGIVGGIASLLLEQKKTLDAHTQQLDAIRKRMGG